jgi:hypothetical protein
MIKSNWPIQNLIMFLDLIFYANLSNNNFNLTLNLHYFSFFGHNSVQLGFEFPPKLQLYSPICFLHIPSLYFILFIFILKKK